MNGLLVDVDLRGQRALLLGLFQQPDRIEFWNHLACTMPTFEEVGLEGESSDLVVWQTCQERRLVLLTANRNQKGKEPLEWVIRTHSVADSLPVLTLRGASRFMTDADYRHSVADRVLEKLFEIDRYLGVGRLWVP